MLGGSVEPELRKRVPPVLSGLMVGTRTSDPNSAAAARLAAVFTTPLGSPPTDAVNCTTAGASRPSSTRFASGARLYRLHDSNVPCRRRRISGENFEGGPAGGRATGGAA